MNNSGNRSSQCQTSVLQKFHKDNVQTDIENRMQFNTAIAAVMEHLNNVYAIKDVVNLNDADKAVFAEACLIMPRLLHFFAPHISEELWQKSGQAGMVHSAGLPSYTKKFLKKDEVTYVVQIMGKIRGNFEISANADQEAIKKAALAQENVQKHLEGKEIKKIIVVPKKLVSIVAK